MTPTRRQLLVKIQALEDRVAELEAALKLMPSPMAFYPMVLSVPSQPLATPPCPPLPYFQPWVKETNGVPR